MIACTLCKNDILEHIEVENDKRKYLLCLTCHLIFIPPQYQISRSSSKLHYLNHNNTIEQEGYVNFLNRVITPALELIKPGMKGLDYGCGPSPVLSKILELKGILCYNYDPLFDFDHPLEIYDFVFATECFEHFNQPEKDIKDIVNLVKPGGFLGLMTHQWETIDKFRNWYYKNDPTHVSFYHRKTFDFISDHYNLKYQYNDNHRTLILKN